MPIIEAHGQKFAVAVTGIDHNSTAVASFAHNLRQELLALPPASVAALHKAGLLGDFLSPNSPLERMVKLASDAAGLPTGQLIDIRPIEN